MVLTVIWARAATDEGLLGGGLALAPRQFMLLLSVTAADGTATYFHSATAAAAAAAAGHAQSPAALTFSVTAGPAQTVDMFKGEDYDGRVAAALEGWASPGYVPSSRAAQAGTAAGGAAPAWVAAVPPALGPATWGAQVHAHHAANIIQTKQVFTPTSITQPVPGSFVFDVQSPSRVHPIRLIPRN